MKRCPFIPAIVPAIIAAALCFGNAEARKIRTRHKIEKKKTVSAESSDPATNSGVTITVTPDSVALWGEAERKVRFYGFDKTVASNMESFFITNGLDTPIDAVGFDIVYLDMKGRQLHRRHVDLKCNVAPGETMRHDIKSWDTQKSFYFHQSAKPRRQATPFDVRIELKSVSTTVIPNPESGN